MINTFNFLRISLVLSLNLFTDKNREFKKSSDMMKMIDYRFYFYNHLSLHFLPVFLCTLLKGLVRYQTLVKRHDKNIIINNKIIMTRFNL